jgi:hypothetical protein
MRLSTFSALRRDLEQSQQQYTIYGTHLYITLQLSFTFLLYTSSILLGRLAALCFRCLLYSWLNGIPDTTAITSLIWLNINSVSQMHGLKDIPSSPTETSSQTPVSKNTPARRHPWFTDTHYTHSNELTQWLSNVPDSVILMTQGHPSLADTWTQTHSYLINPDWKPSPFHRHPGTQASLTHTPIHPNSQISLYCTGIDTSKCTYKIW